MSLIVSRLDPMESGVAYGVGSNYNGTFGVDPSIREVQKLTKLEWTAHADYHIIEAFVKGSISAFLTGSGNGRVWSMKEVTMTIPTSNTTYTHKW